MHFRQPITILVLLIALASLFAASAGIWSDSGEGPFLHESVRGETVEIYGRGIYRHMSAEVAIQGIAQDYVTLFAGIPLLLLGLYFFRRGDLRGKLLLAGVLLYFFMTYLFYTAMGAYNELFLAYTFLLMTAFFAVVLILMSFDYRNAVDYFPSARLMRATGFFVVINSLLIAALWLSIIVPPLLEGSLYPAGLHHYTTLIVQGFDLGLFLPMGVAAGWLAIRKNNYGYIFITVYVIFMVVLMTALTAKVLFMARAGADVIPVIFIMPTVALLSIVFSALILRKVKVSAAPAT